jgi:DNA-binding NarL/FixJ family response regulator
MFVVQNRIHADGVSRHESREDAIAAIDEMIRSGLAEPDEFSIREMDETGRTIAVFTPLVSVPSAGAAPLTGRELEVLQLLAEGLTNREIGERLSISPTTVRVHVRHVLVKLGARSRTDAVVTARRGSLVA